MVFLSEKAIANHPLLLALQRGLFLVMPLIMIGALALMLRDLPSYASAFTPLEAFASAWRAACDTLIAGSFGIASLAVLCSCSAALVELHNRRRVEQYISPILAAAVVMSCFFMIAAPSDSASWRVLLSLDRGLLFALGVSWSATQLFLFFARCCKLRLSTHSLSEDPYTSDVLSLIPAGMLTIVVFALLRALYMASGITEHAQDWSKLLEPLLAAANDNLSFVLFYEEVSQLFWFVGAHGPNILFLIEDTILTPAGLANGSANALGEAAPFIVTKPFIDVFVRMGGSGCTLALIFAILCKSQDARSRKLCLFALLPALCNVNEPLLFGIPIVFNPLYFIPFMLTPLAQTISAYAATASGLVPNTIANPTWTTPTLVSGFQATGSVAGSLMQVFNLVLGAAIYLPFVRLADRQREQQGRKVLDSLLFAAECCWVGPNSRKCLDLPGEQGCIARTLASELQRALHDEGQLFLEYQPQVDIDGRVHGVEALLRWRHPVYGIIPPPITVALAEDIGCIGTLGLFVLNEACARRHSWISAVPDGLTISVNVSPKQLSDSLFAQSVMDILANTGLPPAMLVLEITESSVLEPTPDVLAMLRQLREAGVGLAIDDFGMGHSSLRYLRELPVDTIKIDRSLTLPSPGKINESIVRSVVELSVTLGIVAVLEGVETPEQLAKFISFGCRSFQGYLFSRPVSGDECLAFIVARHGAASKITARQARPSDRAATQSLDQIPGQAEREVIGR